MIIGSICMSHSPLKEQVRPRPEIEKKYNAAVRSVADFIAESEPDLTIVFYPDHINGFFYGLLPSFCIGLEGASIGDWGTAAGKLDIPAHRAAELARSVLDAGVDVAISHQMQVDHGGVQPLEMLSETFPLQQVIPIFVNCAAPPLPTFSRVRALGRAVGAWAASAPERILIIGSGGLSHDPPMAELATAAPEARQRLIAGAPMNHAQRLARQSRARGEGVAMAAGRSKLLPANAEWDRQLLDAFAAQNLSVLDERSQEEVSRAGGRGGHEARTWVAALAALDSGYTATEVFYEPVDEWMTGMGILQAHPARA